MQFCFLPQIVFRYERTDGPRGLVAVDDISFSQECVFDPDNNKLPDMSSTSAPPTSSNTPTSPAIPSTSTAPTNPCQVPYMTNFKAVLLNKNFFIKKNLCKPVENNLFLGDAG